MKKIKFTLIILLLLTTSESYSQCKVQEFTSNNNIIKICEPTPIVMETKIFDVVLLGLSKVNDYRYLINICQIYKSNNRIMKGNVYIVLDDNSTLTLKILNSYLDNDEEFGLNCLTNIIVENNDITKIRNHSIKYFTYKDENNINIMVTPQRLNNILMENMKCLN